MNNNKSQTAVEWHGRQLGMLFQQYHIGKISITEFHTKRFELEEQAKEMEKKQHLNTWFESSDVFRCQEKTFEEFWEETYGGDKTNNVVSFDDCPFNYCDSNTPCKVNCRHRGGNK